MKSYIRLISFIGLCVFLLLSSCAAPTIKRNSDGLPRSTPEGQGVASENILRFIESIEANNIEVHSFMLMRHGKVISEGWWHPYKSDINHIMHSVSKTFTSTAIGFAVEEKLLKVDDKVISFFPDDLPAVVSPNLEKLTIKHLLTMSTGHEPPPVFTIDQPDWVKLYLAQPIINEPGSVFSYSSYATYMLSAIIQKVSGKTTYEYLQPRLFDTLEIENIQWETDSDGISCGGWGMRIKTSDMAKLGMFYLQNGKWKGKQLLPASWIKEASSVQIYQLDEPTFEQELYDEGAQGYGYQIWRSTHNAYRADGANGQLIIVMPDQDAVIVITSNTSQVPTLFSLLWEHLFPGILERKVIRSDEMTNDLLTSKLSSLHLPFPFTLTDEEKITPLKSDSMTYLIETNEYSINNISFQFDENGTCLMEIKTNNTSYTFPFGLDAWEYGETERPGPYFLNPRRNADGLAPFTITGYASWTQQDELSLRLLYLTESQHETYICNFNDNELQISITNSMEPDKEPVLLKGTL